MILNFEYDKKGEVLIFFDEEGAKSLVKYINVLIEKKDTHIHLMTPSWSGNELTEVRVNSDIQTEPINQVKLQMITDATSLKEY